MRKKTDSILFKLALMFFLITLLVIFITSVNTYNRQMDIYEQQCEVNVRAVGEYLEQLMMADKDAFIFYQNYFQEHYKEVNIPYDFDDYTTAWKDYMSLFAEHHPGKTLGRDLDYDQMDPEVQEAYFIYLHEYWTLTFEAARPVFGLPYTYYLWVKDDKQPPAYSVVYMIDGERSHKPNAEEYVYLGDEYDHDANNPDNAMEWQAWSSGEKPEGYQVWDNEYGHTYAYYTPLIIDGQKMGLIATEVEVAEVESSILNNTIAQVSGLGAVLVMAMIALLLAVYGNYISKLVRLESDIREYSETKDSVIADRIYEYTSGKSEIASLSRIVADTIKELGTYMKNLVQTRQELTATREKADAMSQLATKDALTGIRNKTAYDLEVQNLERAGLEGVAYGLAVVDLNNLKHINDTYGHECGNVAIKKLCRLVCEVFDHSPVFRVGGDEFAVILKNRDLKDIDELIEEFYGITAKWEEDENLKPWEKTSAAIGYAVYDPEKDESIKEVFNRADANMYDKKRRMKEEMSGDAQ